MPLPPEILKLKRKRNEEPVDLLCMILQRESTSVSGHQLIANRHPARRAAAKEEPHRVKVPL